MQNQQLYFHHSQRTPFLIYPIFSPPLFLTLFFAPHFNLLCAQLSIFICNLSFSPNAMSLSCLLSRHSHCVSSLMEFRSYPFRCSCFSRYLMSLTASLPSRLPHLFLDLPPCVDSDFLWAIYSFFFPFA